VDAQRTKIKRNVHKNCFLKSRLGDSLPNRQQCGNSGSQLEFPTDSLATFAVIQILLGIRLMCGKSWHWRKKTATQGGGIPLEMEILMKHLFSLGSA